MFLTNSEGAAKFFYINPPIMTLSLWSYDKNYTNEFIVFSNIISSKKVLESQCFYHMGYHLAIGSLNVTCCDAETVFRFSDDLRLSCCTFIR